MLRLLFILLLVYFAANLLLALTMMFVAFIESILKLSGSKENNKTQPSESTIEISSIAFGFGLAASVITFGISVNGTGTFTELGHSLLGVFISVTLGVMLLILIKRSKNKLITSILSILIFMGIRYLLTPIGYWGSSSISIPFIGGLGYFYVPILGNILDPFVVLFFIMLILIAFRGRNNIKYA